MGDSRNAISYFFVNAMTDKKICELRKKLNESIVSGEDYSVTYKLSVELDKLIAQYYRESNV